MRILYPERKLIWLSSYDEELGFSFVLANHDVYDVIQACPRLKKISIQTSLLERMPCLNQKLLTMQKIEVVAEDERPPKYANMCNTCIWRPHLHAS